MDVEWKRREKGSRGWGNVKRKVSSAVISAWVNIFIGARCSAAIILEIIFLLTHVPTELFTCYGQTQERKRLDKSGEKVRLQQDEKIRLV